MSFGKRSERPATGQGGAPIRRQVRQSGPAVSEPVATVAPEPAAEPVGILQRIKRGARILGIMFICIAYGPAFLSGVVNRLTGGSAPNAAPDRQQGSAAARQQQAPRGGIVNVETGDAEMTAARSKARASLDRFWAEMDKPSAGATGHALKVGLPTPDGNSEHIWVNSIQRKGDQLAGRLSNDPRNLPGLKAGSPVTFTSAQIDDWMFQRNGKIVGNETMRPLLKRMPEAEAARYRAMLEQP